MVKIPFGKKESDIPVSKNTILKSFPSVDEYKKFVQDVVKNSSERKDDVKKYNLE